MKINAHTILCEMCVGIKKTERSIATKHTYFLSYKGVGMCGENRDVVFRIPSLRDYLSRSILLTGGKKRTKRYYKLLGFFIYNRDQYKKKCLFFKMLFFFTVL